MKTEKDQQIEELALASSEKKTQNGYLRIFTYAQPTDIALEIVAIIAACASGTALALLNIVLGQFITIITRFVIGETTNEQFMTNVSKYCMYFVYIGIARFVLTYIYATVSTYCAYNIVRNIRRHYFKSALRQEVAFFDKGTGGSISMQATSNGNLIHSGIAEKLALCFQAVATFVAAFIIAFISQWKLTLMLIWLAPALLVLVGSVAGMEAGLETQILEIYAQAGAYAESILSTPRTVHAFGIRDKLVARYEKYLVNARLIGDKKGVLYGVLFSAEYTLIYCGMALAFWQGVKMIVNNEVETLGTVFTVLMSVMIAIISITMIAPYTVSFTRASQAATQLFTLIDRVSQIDPFAESGVKPVSASGVVDIENIMFSYPTRPGVTVLKQLSLHVPAGKVTAICGPSGCGKSTIISLIERWYLPDSGEIKLDGIPTEDINLNWLRTNVRLVQQEPVLYNGTVFENIANGLVGTAWENVPRDEQQTRVEEAAKFAFAHDFISKLPEGYDTLIGERGGLLSGGEKQRIAIARSIVSSPKVLLLDEATSSLDPHAEASVQKALDNVSSNRTTIVIAHKLATIKKADNIVVMTNGAIVEQGTHGALIEANGVYARLVQAQDIGTAVESEEKEEKMELSKTLTNYPTNVRERMERLSDRENYTKFKQYGLIRSILNLAQDCPELKWVYAAILVLTISAAGVFPGQALLFANELTVFQLPPDQIQSRGNFIASMFVVVSAGCLIIYFTLGYLANIVAQTMSQKGRRVIFDSMLRQDVQFFDRPENTVGALNSRLDSNPQAILELMGFNIGLIIINLFNILGTSILALVISWRLGVVGVFAGLPPMLIAGYARIRLETRMDAGNEKRFTRSAAIASEAILSIRTVSSLAIEQSMLKRYTNELDHAIRNSILPLIHMMFWFSFTQSIEYFILALGFWWGCKLLSEDMITFYQFFVSFMGVFFSGQAASQMFGYTTSITKGKSAANYYFWMRSLQPIIRETPESRDFTGGRSIDIDNVQFSYPLRSNTRVLKGINLKIKKGDFTAFVGASGCGKSTMIAMLERFYDPTDGQIKVDSEGLSTINPDMYRKNVSLVQQEPTLYQGTIRENIEFGGDGNVDDALHAANAYEFVMSLPEGLNTLCGTSGSQLSGGQRQRIAIARALIRDPKIILLDEATSNLDTESEKQVQKALAAAALSNERITIAVAHRLSTIKDADRICVFYGGKIIEMGTHGELIALGGIYMKMCVAQSLDR